MKCITAIIVGAGHRSMIYGSYSKIHPDELKIVGVAEPDKIKRDVCQKEFDIDDKMCFENADELARQGKIADVIINGTMDRDHISTSIPLLKLGYDMLLEKPFACNDGEIDEIEAVTKEHGNKVMICHVLRYSDFYRQVRDLIDSGVIGDIEHVQTSEDVSYHHYVTSYVRGKWANSDECNTSFLLAKCCHDIDIIMWMMGKRKPVSVSSIGGKMFFGPENAPKDCGERCLKDCKYVDTCTLSARRIYMDLPHKWDCYVWPNMTDATYEEKYDYLRDISPYGRCAFKCGNNVLDHQSVIIKFDDGTTASHNLTANSAYSKRMIRVFGTKGEIEGTFEDQRIVLSVMNPTADGDCVQTVYDLSDKASATVGHGGGDMGLVKDFIKYVNGEQTTKYCTALTDSIRSHRVIFAADTSLANGGSGVPVRD